jgi:hypothetical protein
MGTQLQHLKEDLLWTECQKAKFNEGSFRWPRQGFSSVRASFFPDIPEYSRNSSGAPGRKQRHCGKLYLTMKGGINKVLWIVAVTGMVIIALFLYLRFRAAKRIERNIAF